MRKFWIIRKAPIDNPGVKRALTKESEGYAYDCLEEAERRAQGRARKDRAPYVVLEVVSCFDVADVVRVDIEE